MATTLPPVPATGNRFVHYGVSLLKAYASCERHIVRRLAEDYLRIAERYADSRHYGNAIHQANTVLGLLELERGRIEVAEQYLVRAACTPGSPQLSGMGPNMLLAKKLLEAGRTQTVLEYLTHCGKIWKLSFGRIWMWKLNIRRGRTPDFGANLSHLLDYKSFG
ncbi:hypothetical protein [Neolewinella litorea]|uniref:Tetratricopeptide repeat protein n=1 Tax=Neolewinella litorea TaxID=2562452 RepID=A0A4S4NZI8_9BACT|nr:hypothetical protein [Neolewinella litorea]THH41720.1 hypothetical protein E4021_03750 [Neolewinella litorea]